VFYLVSIVAINWKTRDASLLIYPLYSLFYTLVMVPIGVVAYGAMAFKYKNFGVISARRAGSGGVTTWASGEGGIPNVHVGVECSPPQRSWLRPQARADGGDNSFDLAHGLTEIGGESRDVSVGVECSPPQRSWRRA